MQVSAGRVTPVLWNGRHAGSGLLGRTPHAAQMTAVPEHAPPEVVAVKETWGQLPGKELRGQAARRARQLAEAGVAATQLREPLSRAT